MKVKMESFYFTSNGNTFDPPTEKLRDFWSRRVFPQHYQSDKMNVSAHRFKTCYILCRLRQEQHSEANSLATPSLHEGAVSLVEVVATTVHIAAILGSIPALHVADDDALSVATSPSGGKHKNKTAVKVTDTLLRRGRNVLLK